MYLALQLSNLFNVLRLQSLRQPVVKRAAGFFLSRFLVLDLQEKKKHRSDFCLFHDHNFYTFHNKYHITRDGDMQFLIHVHPFCVVADDAGLFN